MPASAVTAAMARMSFLMISCLCPACAPELSGRRKKRPDKERPRCWKAQLVVCDFGGYAAVRDTNVEWATSTFMPAGPLVVSTLASR